MDKLVLFQPFASRLPKFLDHASLAACVRVSSAWHRQFVPYLWYVFGSVPSHPLRFGLAHPPATELATLPLHVPDPPNRTVQALAFANPELYPEYLVDRATADMQQRPSMWTRLFLRQQVTISELEQMRTIIARNGHHIRVLTVRSLPAFRLFEPFCTHLQALHLRFDGDWVKNLSIETIQQTKKDVIDFVLRQSSTMVALHLHLGLVEAEPLRHMIRTHGCERWMHFDVMMEDQDYHGINHLLPNIKSIQFFLPSLNTLYTPLPVPHVRLRELDLLVDGVDARAFAAIVQSFPNLQRLIIRDMFFGTLLDLSRDHVGSMLQVGRRTVKSKELAQIIRLIPDLLMVDSQDLDADCFTALTQSCPRLVYPVRLQ
ncbi:hypothetical protein BGZ73_009087 [Actinomortierella ambigua]|nr:hypothetical protein BGZ73_009087 [Actinomortierella ambigua]